LLWSPDLAGRDHSAVWIVQATTPLNLELSKLWHLKWLSANNLVKSFGKGLKKLELILDEEATRDRKLRSSRD
jgi:hypothetical protein